MSEIVGQALNKYNRTKAVTEFHAIEWDYWSRLLTHDFLIYVLHLQYVLPLHTSGATTRIVTGYAFVHFMFVWIYPPTYIRFSSVLRFSPASPTIVVRNWLTRYGKWWPTVTWIRLHSYCNLWAMIALPLLTTSGLAPAGFDFDIALQSTQKRNREHDMERDQRQDNQVNKQPKKDRSQM